MNDSGKTDDSITATNLFERIHNMIPGHYEVEVKLAEDAYLTADRISQGVAEGPVGSGHTLGSVSKMLGGMTGSIRDPYLGEEHTLSLANFEGLDPDTQVHLEYRFVPDEGFEDRYQEILRGIWDRSKRMKS